MEHRPTPTHHDRDTHAQNLGQRLQHDSQQDLFARVTAVDRWLDARAQQPPHDWPGLLAALKDQLEAIIAFPLIRDDPGVQVILGDMIDISEMPDLVGQIDRLGERVAVILAQHAERAAADALPAYPQSPATLQNAAARIRLRL